MRSGDVSGVQRVSAFTMSAPGRVTTTADTKRSAVTHP